MGGVGGALCTPRRPVSNPIIFPTGGILFIWGGCYWRWGPVDRCITTELQGCVRPPHHSPCCRGSRPPSVRFIRISAHDVPGGWRRRWVLGLELLAHHWCPWGPFLATQQSPAYHGSLGHRQPLWVAAVRDGGSRTGAWDRPEAAESGPRGIKGTRRAIF